MQKDHPQCLKCGQQYECDCPLCLERNGCGLCQTCERLLETNAGWTEIVNASPVFEKGEYGKENLLREDSCYKFR